MKKLVFLLAISFISYAALAQSDELKARKQFVKADEAYNQEKYQNCIDYLNKVEDLLGSTQPNILYLKTKAYYNLKNYENAKKNLEQYFSFNVSETSYEYKDLLKLMLDNDGKLQEKKVLFEKLESEPNFQVWNRYIQKFPYGYIGEYEKVIPIVANLGLKGKASKEDIEYCIGLTKNYLNAVDNNQTSGRVLNEVKSIKNQLQEKKDALEKEFIEKHWVTDIDGNTYRENIQIGDRWFMSENLKVTRFRNGDPIPGVDKNSDWRKARRSKTPAWCYYENNPRYGKKYGKIYNFYVIQDSRNICPEGWHVPDDDEWLYLSEHLNSELRSRLNAREGGWRDNGDAGKSKDMGEYVIWWSSSKFKDKFSFAKAVYAGDCGDGKYATHSDIGLYIRCIKDED